MLQILSQSKRQVRIMVVAGMILRARRFSFHPSSILFSTYATLQITFHYTNVWLRQNHHFLQKIRRYLPCNYVGNKTPLSAPWCPARMCSKNLKKIKVHFERCILANEHSFFTHSPLHRIFLYMWFLPPWFLSHFLPVPGVFFIPF